MRLKSVFISQYKNLRNFELSFDGDSLIDIFVGKNGCGKSNVFEALIEIFRHLFEFGRPDNDVAFQYRLRYSLENRDIQIEWNGERITVNGLARPSLLRRALPDNVLIYYSGHNPTVSSLVSRYETSFRRRIRGARIEDSRQFLGIGSEYKSLLLAVLLAQSEENRARSFVCRKLGITGLGLPKPGSSELTDPVIRIILQRPEYAKNNGEFDIEFNDETDRFWRAEGITKEFLDRLMLCVEHTPGNLTVRDGFFSDEDRYLLYFSIEKMLREFGPAYAQDLFRNLDNLKTLGMLADISVPLQLYGSVPGDASFFSDGQFQSVYIYAIVELFKDRNCITLLDEPDAFLHPEWQFEFLKQVFEITEEAGKNNHLLLSSHSASTIMTASESQLSLIDFNGDKAVVTRASKTDIIRSLSAGLITFTESEARLSINHVLRNSTGSVLFCEGITDELILEKAWTKLYPTIKCPFDIQTAFDRAFLRNLFARTDLRTNFPNRKMFALFDFDDAYEDWRALKNGRDEVTDPHKGLTKQLDYPHHYAMLLPVPDQEPLKGQVLDDAGRPWGSGDSHLPIELLFFREEWVGPWFARRATSGGGQIIEFVGDKVSFANEVIPNLPAEDFEHLRPVFEFINEQCALRTRSNRQAQSPTNGRSGRSVGRSNVPT